MFTAAARSDPRHQVPFFRGEYIVPRKRTRPSSPLRRIVISCCALLAVAAAVVAPGTSAHAKVDGTGWSWGWGYERSHIFSFAAILPGALLAGRGFDDAQDRRQITSATLEDFNPTDDLCPRVQIIGGSEGEVIAERSACSSTLVEFGTRQFGGLSNQITIVFIQMVRSSLQLDEAMSFTARIPNSVGDPALQEGGAGGSWAYVEPTRAHFKVHRRGTTVSGDVVNDELPDHERTRRVIAAVTVGQGICARGEIWTIDRLVHETPIIAPRMVRWARACGAQRPNPGLEAAFLGDSGMTGILIVRACRHAPEQVRVQATDCLDLDVPLAILPVRTS